MLPWWEAVCLAAIVAPTEIALIDALLDDDRAPDRVRHALSVESGFFIGWMGPRGIGTPVLGLLVVREGDIQRAEVIGTVVVTVTLSLTLHSLTAPSGVRRLTSARPPAAAP